MIKTNEFQTPLTDEFLESLEKEEREQLLDYINNIKFIQNLISPDRKRARDLPRDEDGKIIIDLTNPHILEDMEYFRPTGNYYREHGKYTSLMPNDNPNSEFGIWFTTEINRIWHGMVRPSDGEWITGEMYYYLNYCPIKITKINKKVDSKSKNQKEKFSTRRITDFPEVWEGAYLMFHYLNQSRENNSHSALIARRGMGKSYMLASILSRIFTCGNNEEEAENAQAVITAFSKQYLISDGTLNKFVTMIDHCAKTTEFPRARYKSSLNDMNWIMGYMPSGAPVDTIEGSKNEVIGISAQNNADNSRGKRCLRFVYEEFGKFPNFLETWSTNRYSVQEGEYLFGQQIAIGTGGTEGNDFSGALEMIYHPKGQGVYGVKNVFDKGSLGTNDTIMFLGSYINSKGYYNKDGVSDVVGALLSEVRERLNIKYNASDPMLLIKRKAEMPITLQEAIMKRDSTIYPVDDLNERINQLDNNPSYMNELWVGRLSISGDRVVYTPDSDITPITHYPHQDNKLNGAVIIKEMPQKDSSGVVPFGRYIAGLDPYDDDMSNTLSLGSIYILDLYTDDIVFEYTGRPQFADDFYEICRRALLMYNARCNYENNKKGLFSYFSHNHCLHLLTDTLEFLKDKNMVKEGLYGNKVKGTNTNTYIKAYARRLIRDWLLKPVVTQQIVVDEDGVTQQQSGSIPNLYRSPYRALLQELAQWNDNNNFDRHDALGMLMLLRENELMLMGNKDKEASKEIDEDYSGFDSFFVNNCPSLKIMKQGTSSKYRM